jgi:hypothetical protein
MNLDKEAFRESDLSFKVDVVGWASTSASFREIISRQSVLDFALACGYISKSDHKKLTATCREIGAMLGSMISKPAGFLIKEDGPE